MIALLEGALSWHVVWVRRVPAPKQEEYSLEVDFKKLPIFDLLNFSPNILAYIYYGDGPTFPTQLCSRKCAVRSYIYSSFVDFKRILVCQENPLYNT